MKIDQGFRWGPADQKMKSNRVMLTTSLPPVPYTMYLTKSSVYVGECPRCQKQGNPSRDDPSEAYVGYDFNPGTNPNVTQWQEYVIGIKRQTCESCFDGEFHLWINGVQVGKGVMSMRFCDSSNCAGWAEAWGSNMVTPYPQLNGTSADGGIIWLDDFSLDDIWNSRVGTPPSPPTGLRVQ
jgi:hypothetical protein